MVASHHQDSMITTILLEGLFQLAKEETHVDTSSIIHYHSGVEDIAIHYYVSPNTQIR